jgi:N-methylhydantoinase A
VVHDYIRSELNPLAETRAEHAEAIFGELERKARAELAAERMNPADASLRRELDLRYAGQGYELRTSLQGLYRDRLTPDSLAAARRRFDENHAQVHGHAAKERAVEVVSYRLRLRVMVPKYQPRKETPSRQPAPLQAAIKGLRVVYFDGGNSKEATLYERDRLDMGSIVAGPAIIEQFDATTVIPQSWTAKLDGWRNLVLERES